jgi:membrane protein YdbS with pleckstrin-like domain
MEHGTLKLRRFAGLVNIAFRRPVRYDCCRVKTMFCKKCGRENDEDAAFCQKCGNAFAQSVEPGIGRPQAIIAPIFSITPTTKFVMAGYGAAVLTALVVLVIASFLFPVVSYLFLIPAVLLLLLIPAYFHIKQKLIRYTLTENSIEIDRGLISRTTQNIPLRRVQDVTVTTTFVQRVLGYGDITMDNASEDGGKIVLDNVDSPAQRAELILEQMRKPES